MINVSDILETITMFEDENLDVRTITMGISLLDCCDSDINKTCARVYDKITRYAKNLVATGEQIEKEFGVPIIHKRISVTPIAMILAACEDKDAVKLAVTLEKAATACGVNFIGGFSALVQKGFSPGDRELIEAIPEALSVTEHVCSSVNIGSTKAGINMDAVGLMGKTVRRAAEITADRSCIGCAKLVVFCNAPEDNPFMAGAFHGAGEPDCVINVGVSGPGVVRAALAKAGDCDLTGVADIIKKTAFKITRMGQLVAFEASRRCAVWHCGSVAGAHAGCRRLGGAYTGRDGAGVLRCSRYHGGVGAAQRCGEKRRRDGILPCGRAVRCIYSGHRRPRHDRRGALRLPAAGKAGSDDRGLLGGTGYDQHSRRHPGGGDLRHHRG